MARGESRTITRHVTFFKKLSPEFEVTSDSFTNRDTDVPETEQISTSHPSTYSTAASGRSFTSSTARIWQRRLAFRALSPEAPTAIPHDPQLGIGMEPASQ